MLAQESEHRGIEFLRLLPRDRVAGVVDHHPVVVLDMSGPEPHQRLRCVEIRVGHQHECGNVDCFDLGEGIGRTQWLRGRAGLVGMRLDVAPACGAVRIGAAIGQTELDIFSR